MHDFDTSGLVTKSYTFTINKEEKSHIAETNGIIRIMIKSNFNVHMPIKLGYDLAPINRELGIIYSAFVLIFLYVLIIWEVSKTIYINYRIQFESVQFSALVDDFNCSFFSI